MVNFFNKLSGWKTYITAAIAVLTAILAYLNHTISTIELIAAILAALQTANMRHAMTTTATATAVQAGNPTAKISSLVIGLLIFGSALAMADTTPTTPVSISGIFNELPGLKQGVAFDINSKNACYFTTAGLVGYGDFSLSAGYATSSAVVASLDYDIGGLSKLGLNVPILSAVDLRIGFMVGLSDISTASSSGDAERNKFVYGPEVTIVSLKF